MNQEDVCNFILEECKKIMKNSDISLEDDFFAMGGDSMRAAQLSARMVETYGVEMKVYEILEEPYIKAVADIVVKRHK